MDTERLPADVHSTMASFLTAELTTISAKGSPQTWPVLPSVEWKSGRIVIATSIGLPQKIYNIRRRPDVSLLFSESIGSGLTDPLSVLIEGSAVVSDTLFTSLSQIDDADIRAALDRDAIALLRRQPAVGIYASNPVARALMDWYFFRLLIMVTPRRISWGRGNPREWHALDVA
ncbi:MAG: pyridoxamine 5'-phosphate oxidase family protein [Acidimicrobiia bacterium]